MVKTPTRKVYFGNLDEVFEQLHGKAISYNNLVDLDAAINLISDFEETTFAVIKHNNACGLASRENLTDAWNDALAGDPVSAFGGVLITNKTIDAPPLKRSIKCSLRSFLPQLMRKMRSKF